MINFGDRARMPNAMKWSTSLSVESLFSDDGSETRAVQFIEHQTLATTGLRVTYLDCGTNPIHIDFEPGAPDTRPACFLLYHLY